MDFATSIVGLIGALITLAMGIYEAIKGRKAKAQEKQATNHISPPQTTATPPRSRIYRAKAILYGFITIAIATITITWSLLIQPALKSDPIGSIIFPSANSAVDFPTRIIGNAQKIPNGHKVWPVIYEVGAKYHPSDKPCDLEEDPDGTLDCPLLYIGQKGTPDKGKRYRIELCDADKDTQKKFSDYDKYVQDSGDYTGLDRAKLPRLKIVSQVEVIRK